MPKYNSSTENRWLNSLSKFSSAHNRPVIAIYSVLSPLVAWTSVSQSVSFLVSQSVISQSVGQSVVCLSICQSVSPWPNYKIRKDLYTDFKSCNANAEPSLTILQGLCRLTRHVISLAVHWQVGDNWLAVTDQQTDRLYQQSQVKTHCIKWETD